MEETGQRGERERRKRVYEGKESDTFTKINMFCFCGLGV